ncbi:hypothetical protein HDV57DRAFT_312679 [Trichoderma longibrachiatum]
MSEETRELSGGPGRGKDHLLIHSKKKMALLARMLCDPLWLACGGRKGKEEREKEGKSWEKRRDPLFVPLADAVQVKKIQIISRCSVNPGGDKSKALGSWSLVWRPSFGLPALSQPRRPPAKRERVLCTFGARVHAAGLESCRHLHFAVHTVPLEGWCVGVDDG